MTEIGKPEEVIGLKDPVIRISQVFPLGGQGAQMVFETYCGQSTPSKEIDAIVDKIERVAARQALKGEIAAKQNQLANAELQERNMARDILNIEEHYRRKQQDDLAKGRRNATPMSPKEEQDKRTVEQSRQVNLDTIARLKTEITELYYAIGGDERQAAE